MANTSSALKKIRGDKRKTEMNKKRKDAYKDVRKDVRKAVLAKDSKKAQELLPQAYKKIDKAAKENTIHKKTASRYKAKLAKLVNSIISK